MKVKKTWIWISLLVLLALVVTSCQTASIPSGEKFTFGLLMVGPYNDRGWSQAHYDAGLYVQEKLPGAEMIYVDKVNSADRPGTTPAQLAEDLLSKGAELIIFNSDDMKDSAIEFAQAHPEVPVIHASGDSSWEDGKDFKNLANVANIMGKMEYGKMIAGCAAALTTQTGKIGYLGPLINDETRRLAASAYLGAKYCWENYAMKDPSTLGFKVTWIGFWFNIPGVTSDPTQVADEFYNSGFDVVISGIDTTEGLTEAKKMADAGQKVWAIPYDYKGSCEEAPDVCLGVPYFNWGPAYLTQIKNILNDKFTMTWEWNSPDWKDINNLDTTAVGFVKGNALGEGAAANLDAFINELKDGKNLWTGPINLQDGSSYLEDGKEATDQQIWYLPQLLEGMEGQSVPSE
jgi:simple sugar transport system substrate-binding protein